MLGEYYLTRSQLKGYIFEIVILQLLNRNGFTLINQFINNREREDREGFIELKGRGCWHQIDCPCDYATVIPFVYPIRLIGEAKFHSSSVKKEHIRAFIGVMKDIQENYFVADDFNDDFIALRKTEIGTFFSANGFDVEAEKLAYAHGIKTVSYQNNYLIDRIKRLIGELEKNYISVRCISKNNLVLFKRMFLNLLINDNDLVDNFYNEFEELFSPSNGYREIIEQIRHSLQTIHSNFIGNTSSGVFLHFISEGTFPSKLFRDTDEGNCEVYWREDEFNNKSFYLTISRDPHRTKFYFTPPKSLSEAAMFGRAAVLDEKEHIFNIVNVNIRLNGINRNLILRINSGWLEEARAALR